MDEYNEKYKEILIENRENRKRREQLQEKERKRLCDNYRIDEKYYGEQSRLMKKGQNMEEEIQRRREREYNMYKNKMIQQMEEEYKNDGNSRNEDVGELKKQINVMLEHNIQLNNQLKRQLMINERVSGKYRVDYEKYKEMKRKNRKRWNRLVCGWFMNQLMRNVVLKGRYRKYRKKWDGVLLRGGWDILKGWWLIRQSRKSQLVQVEIYYERKLMKKVLDYYQKLQKLCSLGQKEEQKYDKKIEIYRKRKLMKKGMESMKEMMKLGRRVRKLKLRKKIRVKRKIMNGLKVVLGWVRWRKEMMVNHVEKKWKARLKLILQKWKYGYVMKCRQRKLMEQGCQMRLLQKVLGGWRKVVEQRYEDQYRVQKVQDLKQRKIKKMVMAGLNGLARKRKQGEVKAQIICRISSSILKQKCMNRWKYKHGIKNQENKIQMENQKRRLQYLFDYWKRYVKSSKYWKVNQLRKYLLGLMKYVRRKKTNKRKVRQQQQKKKRWWFRMLKVMVHESKYRSMLEIKQKYSQLIEDCKMIECSLEESRRQKDDNDKVVQQLGVELGDKQGMIKQQEEQIRMLGEEIEKRDKLICGQNKNIKRINGQNEQMDQKIEELKKQLDGVEGDNCYLKEQMQQLQKGNVDNLDLYEAVKEWQNKYGLLENKLKKSLKIGKELKMYVEQQNGVLESKEQELVELKVKTKNMSLEIDSMRMDAKNEKQESMIEQTIRKQQNMLQSGRSGEESYRYRAKNEEMGSRAKNRSSIKEVLRSQLDELQTQIKEELNSSMK